jgi:TonB family protein
MLRKKAEERYQTFEELLRIVEPLWRKHQRECMDFMLAQSRDFVRRGELPAARKILLQARLVDATRTVSREMLEKVNAALKDKLLPAEVEERLERAGTLRSEGLLEEARAAAKSALDLDIKSESARLMVEEITREMELLEQAKQNQRAPALVRLLTAMRAAIQRGSPAEAIRLGREALGRAGHDTRVSELVELAERKLREQSSGTGVKPPAGSAPSGDLEISLYPKDDASEKLIREYVFESMAPRIEKSDNSLPSVGAQALEATPRVGDSKSGSRLATVRIRPEGTTKKQTLQRSGTMLLPQPTSVSPAQAWWKKPMVYVTLAAVAGGAVVAAMGWKRPRTSGAAVQTATAPTNSAPGEDRPKAAIAPPHETSDREVSDKMTSTKKDDDEQLFSQAQRLARNPDAVNLQQAQRLLERVIAENGPRRDEAEQLRTSVLQRLSKNEQDLQRNKEFSILATEARRHLDSGDITAARGKLSEIRRLGGDDESLGAEIGRTERARFAALESEYQRDAQIADERARTHLGDLQRQFRGLADGGSPIADNARNYAENLIPAKISEIAAKLTAAKNSGAEEQTFDGAVKDYQRFLEARDANSLKTVVLPRFQAIVQGGGTRAADAGQYVDNLIPAAIRQLTPYPTIGCAEVPSGLGPSVKAGDLVACGLLDQPRLKWVRFTWPEFPARARQAGQAKGIAMLTLTVDENGNVLEAKPRGRSDAYGFVDAAIEATRNWKTNPPRVQSKPVRTQFSADISFSNN